MSHTTEPWKVSGTEHIVAGGNYVVALDVKPEDARRIVACVNACAGIPTEVLEDGGLETVQQSMCRLTKQRDEWKDAAQTEANNAKYWRDAHDEVCTGYFDVEQKLKQVTKQHAELLAALEGILAW